MPNVGVIILLSLAEYSDAVPAAPSMNARAKHRRPLNRALRRLAWKLAYLRLVHGAPAFSRTSHCPGGGTTRCHPRPRESVTIRPLCSSAVRLALATALMLA